MDRRFGVIYWAVVHTGTAKIFFFGWILYSRCMSHHFHCFSCPSQKRLWGVSGPGRGLGEAGISYGRSQRTVYAEVLGWDEPVDTGDGGLGDDDRELGNVHECTHLDISYLYLHNN